MNRSEKENDNNNNNNEDSTSNKYCSCSRDHLSNITSLPAPSLSLSSQSKEILMKLNNLELINLSIALQTERIKTYVGYNNALDELINTKTIHEYPHLCSELTLRFAVISENIIIIKVFIYHYLSFNLFYYYYHLQDILIERKLNNIATLINIIQEDEKEKLILVAAKHLDEIQERIPELKLASNSNVTVFSQSSYNNERIQVIERKLSEHMENLIGFKIDIVENENGESTK